MEGQDENKKAGQEEKIRELEEKIKRLEEERQKKESGGVAGGVLRGLGNIIPGLGGLIKGLGKSSAFRERLEAIGSEVDRKLRETPLKRVETGKSPHIRTAFSVRSLAEEKGVCGREPAPKVHSEELKPEKLREVPVDVFDEGDHLRIIAELAGVEEKDIKVELEGGKLTISAHTTDRKYHQEVNLSCVPGGSPKTTYKNGVLEVKLEKSRQLSHKDTKTSS